LADAWADLPPETPDEKIQELRDRATAYSR